MDKAEKVFEKLAKDFRGYISPEGGPSKAKAKKLEERGFRQVAPSEYIKRKGSTIRSRVKKKRDKVEGMAEGVRTGLTGIGGAAGAGIGGSAIAQALKKAPSTKLRAALTLGGAALGGLGGYALGDVGVKKTRAKSKKVDKVLNNYIANMSDKYEVMGADRKFYTKDTK